MTSEQSSSRTSGKWLPISALILVQLIFGFNYAATKVILDQYPPILWGAIRLMIAAILMFAAAFFIVPKSERRVDLDFMKHVFVYSFFGIALNQAFFMLGLHYTTNTNCAILNTLTPIFTLLFAILAKKEKWTTVRGFGFLVAVMGVLVIRNVEDFQMSSATMRGDLYTLANCACLALFFIISRDFLLKNSPFWATAWMFLYGSIVLFAASIPDWGKIVPDHVSTTLGWSIAYNIIGATMITYFLNSWTLTKVKSSSVALFIYMQPVIAVFNAWYSFNETPTVRMFFAMALIFLGVGLGALKRA
jgi:drug/metabolite transporter (DMT)-like permease